MSTKLLLRCTSVCRSLSFRLFKFVSVCRKRSLFDDRPVEIQELTYIIKQDITSLKRQIQQLEDAKENSMPTSKKDQQKHNTSVVKTLRVGYIIYEFIKTIK